MLRVAPLLLGACITYKPCPKKQGSAGRHCQSSISSLLPSASPIKDKVCAMHNSKPSNSQRTMARTRGSARMYRLNVMTLDTRRVCFPGWNSTTQKLYQNPPPPAAGFHVTNFPFSERQLGAADLPARDWDSQVLGIGSADGNGWPGRCRLRC